MSWRPEGWENNQQSELDLMVKGASIQLSDSIENLQLHSGIFEAGADVMLKSLIKTGTRIETIKAVEIPISFPANTNGYLVFIPDQEVEDRVVNPVGYVDL